ncbi:hypothetical protein [Nonomuraea dietziae]|uniref:hypothetical protein n=1 Tax=Nonomuraea dietziae TaxID=65515 RepID=UPI0031DD3EA5
MTSDESVAAAVKAVVERVDRLDVLVNNAGVGWPVAGSRRHGRRHAPCAVRGERLRSGAGHTRVPAVAPQVAAAPHRPVGSDPRVWVPAPGTAGHAIAAKAAACRTFRRTGPLPEGGRARGTVGTCGSGSPGRSQRRGNCGCSASSCCSCARSCSSGSACG